MADTMGIAPYEVPITPEVHPTLAARFSPMLLDAGAVMAAASVDST